MSIHVYPVQIVERLRRFISYSPGDNLSADAEVSADTQFQELALDLFAFQFHANAAYRRYCESVGAEPRKVRQWRDIPAVPPAAFKEAELTSIASGTRTAVFHSSGTSGQRPSRHYHHQGSLALYDLGAWKWFRKCTGIEGSEFGSVAALTPPPDAAPTSSLVHMFENFRVRLGINRFDYFAFIGADGGWEIDSPKLVRWLKETSTTSPVLLLGTAFSFVHLVEWLGETGHAVVLPGRSRILETGGYKGRSRTLPKRELYGLITERLGVEAKSIFSEYGMSELGSQAYDIRVGEDESGARIFRFGPWVRTRIISPENGKDVAEGRTGLLRIFDLTNVWSVMAIQTEDLAVKRGDGFELVGRDREAEPRGCSLLAFDE
jgi:hypothetical protein